MVVNFVLAVFHIFCNIDVACVYLIKGIAVILDIVLCINWGSKSEIWLNLATRSNLILWVDETCIITVPLPLFDVFLL